MLKTSLAEDGRHFYARFNLIVCGLSCVAPIGVCVYLVALLHLSPDQVTAFWLYVLAVAVVSTPIGTPTFLAISKPIRRYLDARSRGDVSPEMIGDAYATAVNLPGRLCWIATALVVWPSTMLAIVMLLQFEDFGWQRFAVVMTAGLGCAPCSALLQAYVTKFWLAPLREHLAERVDDGGIETPRVRRLHLRWKLQLAIVATTVAPVLFALLYALDSGYESVAERVLTAQPRWLASVMDDEAASPTEGLPGGLALAESRLRALGLEARLALLDRDADQPSYVSGGGTLRDFELAWIRGHGDSGSSADLKSPNLFHWQALDARHSLVVFTPRAALQADLGGRLAVLGVVLLVTIAFGCLMGRVAAHDVGIPTGWLVEEADRIAGGDLSSQRIVSAEDELGQLGRSFARMRRSLRETVLEVTRAADRVEAGSGLVHEAAAQVTRGAEQAARGADDASHSMENLRDEATGVSRSAADLSLIVDQSGSASSQLLAGSRALSDTARELSSQVDSVGSSIEEMVRSVRQVRESSDSLRETTDDTSSSVEQMARSMREVDETAQRTTSLSQQVERAAARGRETVERTVQGIASIQDTTADAQRVIRELGSRAGQIGAILDVIDDVAEETNLLALNAAIIAAQSGEQGRAFAVVADEIKDLADRVLASTREISDLIRGVQRDTAEAVKAISRGAESVAEGVALAGEAGSSLEEIDRTSRESGACIAQIGLAVREQSSAVGHVASLMERLMENVEQIQRAVAEHEHGSEAVLRSSTELRDGAHAVARTSSEQADGCARIREGVEGVRHAVGSIETALRAQADSGERLAGFLESTGGLTGENRSAAESLERAAADLGEESARLRRSIDRFRLGSAGAV